MTDFVNIIKRLRLIIKEMLKYSVSDKTTSMKSVSKISLIIKLNNNTFLQHREIIIKRI